MIDDAEKRRKEKEVHLDAIRGCIYGGAAGDALGYPVEFMTEGSIFSKYGKKGITEFDRDPQTGKALISDDTQDDPVYCEWASCRRYKGKAAGNPGMAESLCGIRISGLAFDTAVVS